ncbi:MAG: hypothetical protein IPG94_03795 [Kineosporiaceae bacterium]|nr:hypothetical protein [Kineosporiaceae bacterium]
MSVRTDIRKTVSQASPVMAAVGVTDLAVERVRQAVAEAGHLQEGFEARVTKIQLRVEKAVGSIDPAYLQKFLAKTFDPKALQTQAKEVPALALTRALEMAGKVEHRYEDLAERGKQLVLRLEEAPATQEFVQQSKATVSRGKALVTTAQHAAEATLADAKATLTVGRKELDEVVDEVEQAVVEGTKSTRAAVKKTAATAKTKAATTRSATKRAATTARGAASKAAKAAEKAAETIGD